MYRMRWETPRFASVGAQKKMRYSVRAIAAAAATSSPLRAMPLDPFSPDAGTVAAESVVTDCVLPALARRPV